jgi:hypothetical protein
MLIYSRAIPESDQEPLQWPEDVVVRGSAGFFLSIFLSYRHPLSLFFTINSGPFSATISFSFEISRRVLPVQPRVKPSKYLFHRLLPYPASLRRWKCPSLLESPWTCPTESRRKTVDVDGSFVTRQGGDGETSRTMPALLFLLLFCNTFRYNWTAYCTNLF